MKSQPPQSLDQQLDALRISPIRLGLILALLGVGVFVASELLLGRHKLLAEQPDPVAALKEARIAVVNILLSVYLPLATLVVRARTRQNLRVLATSQSAPAIETLAAQVGSSAPLSRWLARGAGVGLLIFIAYLSTERQHWHLLWDFGAMAPEVYWHRILAFWVGWWAGEFVHTAGVESARMTASARLLDGFDLLIPSQLEPYTRQALVVLLTAVGLGSLVALLLFERGYAATVVLIWGVTLSISAVTLWMSLRGIRERIREAKQVELDRCRGQLAAARVALSNGQSATPPLSELVAWESRIAAVREWPFDSSALTRVALYGLIPLVSWSGGALVERLLDALLD